MILLAALLLAGERVALGVWERWAAFRDGDPIRCFAIAQPVLADGTTDRRGAFASVAVRQADTGGPAIFVRLSQPRNAAAAITLAIGERRFALVGDRRTARPPDAASDRAIVGAMRGGRGMTIATIAVSGQPLADSYALTGAATAIDAAALGCAGR